MSSEKQTRLLIEKFISTLPPHIIAHHLKTNPVFANYNPQTFNQLVSNFFASFADEDEEKGNEETDDEEESEDEEEDEEESEEEEEEESEEEDENN